MNGLFQQIMELGEENEAATPTDSAFPPSGFTTSGFASAFSGAMSNAFSDNSKRANAAESSRETTIISKAGAATDSLKSSPATSSPATQNAAATYDDQNVHPSFSTASTGDDACAAQLRRQLQLQKKRYDELLSDSHKLRSEYDAYQLHMDHVIRHYKQQALQDKHMLEELRLAGASGSLDEAYVTEMKQQIGKLQKQLSESMTAAKKAYQRQREAEEARAATEKTKREELEDLASQIAQFRATASAPAADSTAAAEGREGEAGGESPDALVADAEEADAAKEASAGGIEPEENTAEAEKEADTAEMVAIHAQLLQTQAQLALRHAEVTELRAQLQQHDSTHQQKYEELMQDVETLRTEIEQSKQHESAQREAQAVALKKAEAEFAEKEAALRGELQAAREQAQRASAEQSSQRVAQELLETQEREQEERMQAKEQELQSARASLQSVQAAVEATHAELREMEASLDDAQAENRQLQAKVDQMNTELLRSNQQLASREDDLLDAEKDRQRLRAMLRQEEEETLRVRQQLTQLQRVEAERGVGTSAAVAAAGSAAPQSVCGSEEANDGEGTDDAAELSSVVATQRQTIQHLNARIEGLEKELTTQEVALRRQQAQTQEISAARIEFMKSKEDANARLAQYKNKISRLESELAAARNSGAAAAATAATAFGAEDRRGAGEAGLLTASMERRQFLLEAKRSADSYRVSRVRHMRVAFFAVLLLVIGMTMYAAFSLSPSPAETF